MPTKGSDFQITDAFGALNESTGWHYLNTTETDLKISCAFLGLFCGITACMIPDAVRTTRIWKRPFFTTFKVLVWLQIASATAFEGMIFAYITEQIPPNFTFFLFVIFFWCLNSQCVMQVQANRISILMNDEKLKKYYKWGLAIILTTIDILVLFTWLPVNLQIKQWSSVSGALLPIDIAVMTIIAACDLGSNIWFVRTIKGRLVALGLTKYDALVKYNMWTLAASLCLDGVVIGMMFYPNAFLYMSLFPIIYQVKMNIELGLSELIVRVASEKTVHRVKGSDRFEEAFDPLSNRIEVAVEEKVESVQEAQMGITPTFGQLIKRPDWASRPKKAGSESNNQQAQTESFDEEKQLGGFELQTVPVQLAQLDEAKEKSSSREGSAFSLE